jgi:excinuclease ABC subunit C
VGVKLFDRKFGRETASELPAAPGIYLFRDEEGAVLYVGKAVNLRRRLAGYRNASRRKAHRKMRILVRTAASLEVRVHPSERDALLEENRLIQALRPPFNVDGAYSFLYPAIGLSAHDGQDLLGFTTDLSAWSDLDFAWYGTFRSRPRAKEAFDVLVEVLSLLAHREPRSRLPRAARPRGSRLVGFRQMSPELRRHLGAYLGGHSSDALVHFAHALLEKPRARRESERVEELLKTLSAFFDSDLRKLRDALSAAGVDGSFIAQEERDPLFIRTARRDADRQAR